MRFWRKVITGCLLLCSCTEQINLVGTDSEIVMQCILTNTDVQTLSLYWTKDYATDKREGIADAQAYLEDLSSPEGASGSGRRMGFTSAKNGDYVLNYSPESGHQYKLTVEIRGRAPITASTRFPQQPALEYNASLDNMPTTLITQFRIVRGTKEPTWFIDARADKEGLEVAGQYYLATTYPLVDTFNASGPRVETMIQSDDGWYSSFLGNRFTLNQYQGSYWDFWKIDPVTGRFVSIVELTGTDPLVHPDLAAAEEVAENFLASPSHHRGIRAFLSEGFDNGQPIPSFTVALLAFSKDIPNEDDVRSATVAERAGGDDNEANNMVGNELRIISVSDEYDRYLRSVLNDDSSDWKKVLEYNNNYSNVSGCAGLFGAAAYCELIPVSPWFGINLLTSPPF